VLSRLGVGRETTSAPKRSSMLSAEEARRIVELIRPHFDHYVARFDERKYPSHVYEHLRSAFETPQEVSHDDIRRAILWKFGHSIKIEETSKIPPAHEELISELQGKWPALSSELAESTYELFLQLGTAIGERRRYVTRSFFLHLLRPSEIPIIDQHNFRALNHYLTRLRDGLRPKSKPSSYEDLTTLSAFLSEILSTWATIDPLTVPSEGELDRFLMMFGKGLKAQQRPMNSKFPTPRASSGHQGEETYEKRLGGTPFDTAIDRLVEHLKTLGRDYIIQGQVNCKLSAHPKPQSLDVWLRKNIRGNPDTKQAVNELVDQLVSSGRFKEGRFTCPDSGRICKGIRLVATDATQLGS
jgi:hypothetical protein